MSPIIKSGYSGRPNRDNRQRAINRKTIVANATHCGICGQRFQPGDNIEADHIIPMSSGGSDDLSNLRATHRSCNRRRGAGW